MNYALHKLGEEQILQTMEVPESLIDECTPQGFAAVPIEGLVSAQTHVIRDGAAVRKTD